MWIYLAKCLTQTQLPLKNNNIHVDDKVSVAQQTSVTWKLLLVHRTEAEPGPGSEQQPGRPTKPHLCCV